MKKNTKTVAILLAFSFLAALPACTSKKPKNSSSLIDPPAVEDPLPESPETQQPETESTPPETPTPPENPDGSNGSNSSNNSNNTGNSGTVAPPEDEEPKKEETSVTYIVCTGDNVNIRSGAGSAYSVVGSAEKGTMYAVIGKTGSWYKTFYKNKAVYINAAYAKEFSLKKSEKKAVEDVLLSGYQLLGAPYVYGAVRYHDGYGKRLSGFSALKFDCSSLTQYAFYQGAGVLLQTTTRLQVKQGKYVAPSDLKRGDCIYFTNESREHLTGVERVGHVAIYLGDNYILHTASDYARIEKISAYRWNHYIEARRFL
ncbi:MAG: C40 family peptidase [Clostridia bacterium]|nr:C40 family peptidase [Clostridia bacterium]